MEKPKYKPIIKALGGNDRLVIGHSNVAQISVRAGGNNEFSKENIRYEVNKFINNYKGKTNLVFMVSVNTPFGFRSGKAFRKGSPISLPDDYEWDSAPSFVLFVWEDKATKGGNDEFNDCLFNTIQKSITTYRLPKDYKTPEQLKTHLGLQRNDKIDINLIPIVETLYSININITGDHSFTSQNRYNPITIHLTLINGHYAIDEVEKVKSSLLRGIPKRTQTLVLCYEEKDKVLLYDGVKEYYLDYEEYYEEKRDNKQNSYISEMKGEIKENGIVATYHEFITECEKLKGLTEGRIDLARSGFKFSNEAKKTLYYSLKAFNEPDPITKLEQQWLFNSTKGALIFSSNCELEKGLCNDMNSAYPTAMCDSHFSFPVLEGEFKQIQELPIVLHYGIYRVIISKSGDEQIDRLFRFNELNYYTHFDVQTAIDLKFVIEVIVDGEANVLLYTRARANGAKYFKETINSLYQLKTKSKLPKRIISAMWGALCEKKKIKRTTRKPVHLNNGETILNIEPIGDELKITYAKENELYKHSYARLGTFLLAKVRRDMMKTILPHNDHIFRFHTDGFIADIHIPDLKMGSKMGEWKIEKQGRVKILNSNIIVWG